MPTPTGAASRGQRRGPQKASTGRRIDGARRLAELEVKLRAGDGLTAAEKVLRRRLATLLGPATFNSDDKER